MTKGIIYGVREHVQESLDGAAALIRNPPARPTIGKMASFVGRMAGKVYAGHESLGFELVLEKDKISEHVGLNALLRYTLGLREMEIFYLDNPISHSRLTSIEYGGNVYSPGASTEAI
ncbi:MAG: hypothetical protein WCK90_04440, partial [archaeon]